MVFDNFEASFPKISPKTPKFMDKKSRKYREKNEKTRTVGFDCHSSNSQEKKIPQVIT
jgi:hypothetical protein